MLARTLALIGLAAALGGSALAAPTAPNPTSLGLRAGDFPSGTKSGLDLLSAVQLAHLDRGLKGVLWVVRKILAGTFQGLDLLHLSLGRQLEYSAENVAENRRRVARVASATTPMMRTIITTGAAPHAPQEAQPPALAHASPGPSRL